MSNKPKETREVPLQNQCPLCFTGMGGTGSQYCKKGHTGYYKCAKCGHTWTAVMKVEVVKIEHKVVELQTR